MFTVKPLKVTLKKVNDYSYEAVVDGIRIGGVSKWLNGGFAAYINVGKHLRQAIPYEFDSHVEVNHNIETPKKALTSLRAMIDRHFTNQGFSVAYYNV